MNKLALYGSLSVAIIFVILFVYAIYAYSRIFWCATVRFSSFIEVEKNIFIDNALENSEARRLQLLIDQAKSRITGKFGTMASNPVIIVVDSHNSPGKYGLGPDRQTVRAYLTPWGAYLVISSGTQDINLLAHEYFHIEICKRMGYLAFKTKLPVWLDEGLAMQVDYRERFNTDSPPVTSADIDRVKTLHRSSDFFTGNNEQTVNNIHAAKAAVHEILNRHSSASLYELFSRVKKGEDIADVFNYQ